MVRVVLRLPKSPGVHKSETRNPAVQGVLTKEPTGQLCHCPCGVGTPSASPTSDPAGAPRTARISGARSPGGGNSSDRGSRPLRQELARLSSLGRGWLVKENEIILGKQTQTQREGRSTRPRDQVGVGVFPRRTEALSTTFPSTKRVCDPKCICWLRPPYQRPTVWGFDRNLLPVLGGWKSKIRVWAGLGLRPRSLACRWLSASCGLEPPFRCASASLLSLPLLIRTPVLLDEGPPIRPR